MNGLSVIFMCYWGGNDEQPFDGPHFLKAPKCAIRAHSRWSYNQLIDEIYKKMGVNREQYVLKVICRFPHSFVGGIGEYFPFNIEDDEGMDIMFDVCAKFSGLSNMQLYVVTKLVETHSVDRGISENITETMFVNSPTCFRDVGVGTCYDYGALRGDGAGTSTQNLVSTQTTNYEIGAPSNNHYDSDHDSEVGESDSDDLGEGSGGPIDDDVQSPLINYEASEYNAIVEGIRFSNKSEAEFEIKRHHIMSNQRFRVKESTPNCWAIECLLKTFPCNFYVRVSRMKAGFWEVTTYRGPHYCVFSEKNQDHVNLDSKFIGRVAVSLIKKDSDVKVGVIIAHINQMYGKTVGYKKAWCGKQKGIAELFGDWEESYTRLPRVLATIQKYNFGTIVEYTIPPPPVGEYRVFERVFWAFGPCIEAFSHCRPVISVDGTFLHGRYKGVILIAMGVDANDYTLPLAFAVVEKEDLENWRWFLYLLSGHIIKSREVCLISDRHWGILEIVAENSWPRNIHHRYCLRHMRANFLDAHKGTGLKLLFWRAGTTCQERKLILALETMKMINPESVTWLNNLDARKWTLAHDGGYRYGIMTTNMSEVFNGVMKGVRGMPITTIVETVFYRCLEYFQVRHGFSLNALGGNAANLNVNLLHQFNPKIHTRYIIYSERATRHMVIRLNTHEMGVYQVTTARRGEKGGNIQVVRINERNCTCGKWVAYHMPCSHMLACCQAQIIDGRSYVDPFYTIKQYHLTWKRTFEPLQREDSWGVDDLVPRFLPNPHLRRVPKSVRPG